MSSLGPQRPLLGQLLQAPLTLDLTTPFSGAAGSSLCTPPVGEAPVLFVTRSSDEEVTVLQQVLPSVGVPVLRINADDLPDIRLVWQGETLGLQIQGHSIQPAVVWLRHFSAEAIMPALPEPAESFRRISWNRLASVLPLTTPWSLGFAAPGQLAQLAVAREAGAAVPPTVVTSRPASALAELDAERVVLKGLPEHWLEATPGQLTGVFPEVWRARDLLSTDPDLSLPVMVQEYIEHAYELRVYYLNGIICAYRVIKSGPLALWTDEESVKVVAVHPDQEVAALTRRICTALGTAYGALDLLVNDEGIWFLEINLNGDWRWFELKAHKPAVSLAASWMLRGMRSTMPTQIGTGKNQKEATSA